MKLKWNGHSCFTLTFANGTTFVTDPFDDTVGYPLCTVRADAALTSHGHFDHNHVQSLTGTPKVFDEPGEYELNGVRITGVASFHDPEQGALRGRNVIFIVEGDGMKIVHLGDLGHMPDETQFEAIKGADILLLPIGGTYTITTEQAAELIAQAKPRAAVAMHFQNEYCKFPITDEKEFVRLTGAERMPNEIKITSDAALPAAIVMEYKA